MERDAGKRTKTEWEPKMEIGSILYKWVESINELKPINFRGKP